MNTTEYPSHIFEAVANDQDEAAKDFVENKYVSLKNLDASNQTVAHVAVKRVNIPILKYFLDKEPYLLTARDGDGFTILHRAAEQGNVTVIKYLIDECKMDPYEEVEDNFRNTALHVAAQSGALDVVKYFLEERDMDASLKNEVHQTPAFAAAVNLHFEVIRYLIESRNVDATEVDIRNDNILFPIVKKKGLDLVKYLLDDRQLDLDVNWRGYLGRTVVHWAARLRQTYMIKYFVDQKKADVNIADDEGWIPLHVAANSNCRMVIKYLVKRKSKFRTKDKKGRTAADLCRNFGAKNFLDGIAMTRAGDKPKKRRSRFDSPESVPSADKSSALTDESVSSNVRTPGDLGDNNERRMQKREISTKSNTTTALFDGNDLNHNRLDTFLVFVGLILRLFGRKRERDHSLSSYHPIAQRKIDRTALAAVYANVDFDD